MIPLKDFYISRIEQKKKGNMEVYNEVLLEMFGEVIPWSKVKEQDSDKQISIMCSLERRILLKKSPIDVKKMAKAIQNSRSGAGGCAMTGFTCSLCGNEETWTNTATPKICRGCATEMAQQIAMYHHDILK